ncbi:hypothetical protein PILCRDRAFT_79546, partial [Piloderma croceum F 1598]
IYSYSIEHDLREVWAYLWENWYRPGQWDLWARCGHPEIPILNNTMILEPHWRRIKRDFLHHFHKPRLDLLVWILITKLAPNYYRKLDLLLNDTGHYRELPSWRKSFKREWKKSANTPIEMPINPKYRPDVQRWVCTCPYFVTSRFLVCKHLVQSVGPVPATFYLQVRRNRTNPFWLHPILQPEGHHIAAATSTSRDTPIVHDNTNQIIGCDEPEDDDDDDGLINTEPGLAISNRRTLRERFSEYNWHNPGVLRWPRISTPVRRPQNVGDG